jgi:hypothetical protein
MHRLYMVLLATVVSGVAHTQSFANNSVWVDHAKIEKEQRVAGSATDGYKGLYNLTFSDLTAQINKNIRYFSTPGAYRDYVDDLKVSGLSSKIMDDILVVQNQVVGKPKVSGSGDAYYVSFDAQQKLITYNAVTTKCIHVDVALTENRGFDLRSSEFSFIGLPRLTDSSACDQVVDE